MGGFSYYTGYIGYMIIKFINGLICLFLSIFLYTLRYFSGYWIHPNLVETSNDSLAPVFLITNGSHNPEGNTALSYLYKQKLKTHYR